VENHPDTQLDVVSLDQEQYKYKLENINIKKSKKLDILSRVFLHSTYFYLNWRKIRKKVLKNAYDLVIIGNSKLGFVAKDFRKNSIKTKVVTHFDNIEYDAVYSYYADKKGLLSKLMSWFDRIVTRRDELCSIKYSKHVFFLSQRDSYRASSIYSKNIDYSIWPVSIKPNRALTIEDSKTIVFLGTLSYGSNLKALEWFLDHVWPKINNSVNFIIAGNNPTQELLSKIKNENGIKIYANFNDLYEIVPKSSLLIAPVFWGAGMKVKVAEALSYGLHIIGTNEAFVGYDILDKSSTLISANTEQDFIDGIYKYLNMNVVELSNNSKLHKIIWKEKYSDLSSYFIFQNFMQKMTEKD